MESAKDYWKAMIVAIAVTVGLLACGSEGGADRPAKPAKVSTTEVGDAKLHRLDDAPGGDYPDVVTWCEGDTLYAVTEIVERDVYQGMGAAGGSVAVVDGGCLEGDK